MAADRKNKTGEEMKQEVLAKLETFTNKTHAKRMHELITQANPALCPRLWYGMPGYAKSKDSAVLVFFREDDYMTFGLTEAAHFAPKSGAEDLLMPCAWFFTELNGATEQKIAKIVHTATQ